VKASVVTTNARAPGGQFVLHARTLPGNPYDGHTLGAVIEATERLTGREIERAYVDKGYRGHDAPNPRRIFISGQKRGVFGRIKRELTRRSAIEAERQPQMTVQLDMHFVDAVRVGDFVEARCTVVRRTRTLVFMSAELVVGERVVATANGVWMTLGKG